jgi:2'-5' RNA ligase
MFVALVPPADVVAALAGRVDDVGTQVSGLRWTLRENWHLTLAFMAAVPTAAVEAAVAELAETARNTGPFALRLRGAGGFPRPGRAGVVWVGVAGETEGDERALARLARHVRIALRRARLSPDRTPFRPHLTLARVRPAADVTGLVAELDDVPATRSGSGWQARDLRLVESRLGAGEGGRAGYTQVATLPLGQ